MPRTIPTDPAALQRPPRRRPEEEEEQEEEEDFFRGAEETASVALFRPKVLGGGGLNWEGINLKLFLIDENVGSIPFRLIIGFRAAFLPPAA